MMNELRDFLGIQRLRFMSRDRVFDRIYRKNHWNSQESRSGPGSTLKATATLRLALPDLIRRHAIKSVLDIPCGDFHWMSTLDLPVESYLGADIVSTLIESNVARFSTGIREFKVLDLVADSLPVADMVICRDVFLHLSLHEVRAALENIKRSRATFLLASTYPRTSYNASGVTGATRLINLQIEPFNLIPPLELHWEDEPTRTGAKAAGLWRVAQLP